MAEQDSAISELMSEALAAFERIRTGDMGVSGSKADPKDGDFHGDPSRPVAPRSADMGVDGVNSEDTDDALNSQFEDLMRDIDFDEVTFAVPDETANDSSSVDDGSAQGVHDGALDAGLIGFGDFDGNGDDPLSQLRKNPTVRNLVTVTFTRSEFMERLGECGLSDPTGTYRMFDAEMDVDGLGALKPVDATFDLRDSRFSPSGSQEEPELSDAIFDHDTAQLFGCRDMSGLSIQRVDLLQRAVGEFHRIAQDSHLESVAKAKQAMDVINTIADPELTSLAPQMTSALIDGKDTPDFSFRLADELDAERIKARDLLFSGQVDQSVELAEAALGPNGPTVRFESGRAAVFQLVCGTRHLQSHVRHGRRTDRADSGQSVLRAYGTRRRACTGQRREGRVAASQCDGAICAGLPAFPISSWRFNWRAPRIGIRPERLASTRCTSHLTVRMRRSPITDSPMRNGCATTSTSRPPRTS